MSRPSPEFAHDRFLVDQLIRPVANLYRVTPLAAGETPAGPPVAYVRQKKLAVKEDIGFYADEGETQELFRIKARTWLDTGGSRYDVVADGERIGVLHHTLRSIIRSTWSVQDPNEQEIALAQERSLPGAIVRRILPYLSDYTQFIPIPYNFDILIGGKVIGFMNRKFKVRDRYVLDLSGDTDQRLDRRVAIALAVGLDTLQNR